MGTILQPCCHSPRQVELGGSRTLCSSQCSRCPCRITIPVQSFSNLQIRGEALPHMWEEGAGWWHKQGWLLGVLWQEKPP